MALSRSCSVLAGLLTLFDISFSIARYKNGLHKTTIGCCLTYPDFHLSLPWLSCLRILGDSNNTIYTASRSLRFFLFIFIKWSLENLEKMLRDFALAFKGTVRQTLGIVERCVEKANLCWNFLTIYGGQEPIRNRVLVPAARLYRLAESIPWNRFWAP
jgi:hypothetical protein